MYTHGASGSDGLLKFPHDYLDEDLCVLLFFPKENKHYHNQDGIEDNVERVRLLHVSVFIPGLHPFLRAHSSIGFECVLRVTTSTKSVVYSRYGLSRINKRGEQQRTSRTKC